MCTVNSVIKHRQRSTNTQNEKAEQSSRRTGQRESISFTGGKCADSFLSPTFIQTAHPEASTAFCLNSLREEKGLMV